MARESTLTNMVVTLFAVCLVSAALLGGLYALTAEPIAAAQTAKINTAIGGVVPAFDNAPSAEKFTVEANGKTATVYPAKKGEEIVGYAIEASSSAGFGGNITLMVGFTPDGAIVNTSVISHAETPGLGAKFPTARATSLHSSRAQILATLTSSLLLRKMAVALMQSLLQPSLQEHSLM